MSFLAVIEGIDGSGKGTQTEIVANILRSSFNMAVGTLSFPRYTGNEYGRLVGRFLNGEFGGLNTVHPLLAATLYAGDRLATKAELQMLMAVNDIVLLDRYVPSNMAHQGAKLIGDDHQVNVESFALADEIKSLEYVTNGMPRPDLIMLLDITPEAARVLVEKKPKRVYTDASADIHEVDTGYMTKVRNQYLALAEAHNWYVVNTLTGPYTTELRSVNSIADTLVGRIINRFGKPSYGDNIEHFRIAGSVLDLEAAAIAQQLRDRYRNKSL